MERGRCLMNTDDNDNGTVLHPETKGKLARRPLMMQGKGLNRVDGLISVDSDVFTKKERINKMWVLKTCPWQRSH